MDREMIPAYLFVGIFILIAVGLLSFVIFMGVNHFYTPTKYSKDCIESLAKKICLEEGMISEGGFYDSFSRGWDAKCLPDRRRNNFEYLTMFESEVERCRK